MYVSLKETMKKFGCTSPFGHIDYLINICKDNNTGKQAFEMFEELDEDALYIPECPYPCGFLKLSATTTQLRGDEKSITIRFGQYIKITEAYYSYTELELIAEFGGYVGLFLGISVFDINQVITRFMNIFQIEL